MVELMADELVAGEDKLKLWATQYLNLQMGGLNANDNWAGAQVWPAAVERVLAAHPKVAEVAVWKRADPEWGERVVAWVVPVDASSPPSRHELAEPVAAALAPWAAPKEVVVVDALPRTPSGKVRRRDLV